MGTVSLSGGQGGPIAVTKVVPSMLAINNGVKARFRIYIKNLNKKGMIYSKGAYSKNCDSAPHLNKVLFGATLSGVPLICKPTTPTGELALNVGQDTIVSCEINLDKAKGVYSTGLTIGMEYAYSQDISKKISVNKPIDAVIPDCSQTRAKK